MSGLSFIGSYSGIDSSTIDKLMEVEASRGRQYTNKVEKYTQEKTTWNDVNTRLDNLFKKLETLQKPETFASNKVSHADEAVFSVTASENAQPADYRLHVERLASSSRLIGKKISLLDGKSSTDALNISGSLELANKEGVGEPKIRITFASEDSMTDILAKINDKSNETGLSASLVDNRLILTDSQMGANELTVDGSALGQLGLSSLDATFQEGTVAKFKIDGLDIERKTNNISDVIEGLTFELRGVHEGVSSTAIKVESDKEKATKAVKEFVDQYNSTMGFIKDQLDVGDPTVKDNKTGALTGDSMLMRIQSGLRNLLTSQSKDMPSSTIKSVKDVGISVDRYGVATFDEASFHKSLEANPIDVRNFFYQQQTVPAGEVVEGDPLPPTELVRTGLAENMRKFIDGFVSKTTGMIKTKNETYDKMIKDMNQRAEAFNERLEGKRLRYVKQFTALDTAMMQAESQMDFMFSQMGIDKSK